MAKPMISVVVSTYNWPEALKVALWSLGRQTSHDFEVLVADDGSGPVTAAVVAEAAKVLPVPVRHIWHEDEGFRLSAIRNRAIAAALGDYIVFIDGDCFVPPDFIATHQRLAESGWFLAGKRSYLRPNISTRILDGDLGCAKGGRARWLLRGLANRCTRPLMFLSLPCTALRKSTPAKWEGAQGCNLGMWKHDIEAVGGFDEAYVGHGLEDSDMVVRLLRSGVKRQRGDYASIVLHLYHPRRNTGKPSPNAPLFQDLMKGQRMRALKGLPL